MFCSVKTLSCQTICLFEAKQNWRKQAVCITWTHKIDPRSVSVGGASVALSVEHWTCVWKAVGSNPGLDFHIFCSECRH